jgi:hypothetical protein
MRIIIIIMISTIISVSCEKSKEFSGNGYFSGFVNGVKFNSDNLDQKYMFSASYLHDHHRCPTDKGNLTFTFAVKRDSLLATRFLIEGVNALKGMKYSDFNLEPINRTEFCKNIPIIYQWLHVGDQKNEAFSYNYIPDKQNFLKIDEVGENYVGGHFKVKFIRKQFMEKGIQSFSKEVLPDSLFFECKRFYAVIQE